MKRNVFIFLSAILAWIFGITMMVFPEKMLDNLNGDVSLATKVVMQWVGVGIFSIGCMNFICRNAHGSKSLRAIMAGNIILHVLGLGFDIFDYSNSFMKGQGLVMGGVVHILMIGGFSYYLIRMKETMLMSSSHKS